MRTEPEHTHEFQKRLRLRVSGETEPAGRCPPLKTTNGELDSDRARLGREPIIGSESSVSTHKSVTATYFKYVLFRPRHSTPPSDNPERDASDTNRKQARLRTVPCAHLAQLETRVADQHALQAVEAVRQLPRHRRRAERVQVAVEGDRALPSASGIRGPSCHHSCGDLLQPASPVRLKDPERACERVCGAAAGRSDQAAGGARSGPGPMAAHTLSTIMVKSVFESQLGAAAPLDGSRTSSCRCPLWPGPLRAVGK